MLVDGFRDARMMSWQARTLQAISGGRFELGLGTGRPGNADWMRALGGAYGTGSQRLRRLADTVATLREQPDRLPLLLAAGGPKMREFAAREGDTVTMAWSPQTTVAEAKPVVDHLLESAGSRSDELELAMNLMAVGAEPAPWLERFIATTPAELLAREAMTVLPGDVAHAVDTVAGWREQLGISYVTINSGFMERFAPNVAGLRGR